MEKLVLIKWDNQLGPTPLYQYPPEENVIPKELILKIWANHEIKGQENQENNFISITYPNDSDQVISLLKTLDNDTYFLIYLFKNKDGLDVRIFQDVLETVSTQLITNQNGRNFNHIFRDAYYTIKNYSFTREKDFFLNLFKDKIKILILNILRRGPLTQNKLKNILHNEYKYHNLNLEVLLTPFIRLNIVEIKNLHGIEKTIFLKNDVAIFKYPPKIQTENKSVLSNIKEFFLEPKILLEDIPPVIKLYLKNGVGKLLRLLREQRYIHHGIKLTRANDILNNDMDLIEQLVDRDFIHILEREEGKKKVFLKSDLHFIRFAPKYLLKTVIILYKKKDLSFEQLIQQLSLLID